MEWWIDQGKIQFGWKRQLNYDGDGSDGLR